MSHVQHRLLILLVTILLSLSPFAVDTYLPAFPDMERQYGIDTAAMSQSLGVFMIALAFSTLAWGPLVDRFGRKSTSLVSLLGFAVASAGCALSPDYQTFMVFRILQGLAVGCGLVAGRSMIRDAFSGAEALKAMSLVMSIFAIAPAIAPLVGALLLDAWGWESIFWFLGLLGLGTAAFLQFYVHETQAPEHVQSIHPLAVMKTYSRALAHHRFLLLAFAVAFAFGGQFIYIAGASRVIYDFLQLSSHHFSVQFVPMVIGMMIGSWLSGRLASKHSAEQIIHWSFIVLLLAVFFNLAQAIWLPHTPFVVIAPLILYSFSVSLLMPGINLLGLDCFPENRGMASSVQGFVFMGGNALVASLLMPFILSDLAWFAIAQMVLALLAMLSWYLSLAVAGQK